MVSFLAVDGWDKDMIEENSEDSEHASDEERDDGLLNLDEEITFNAKKGDKVGLKKIKNVSDVIENEGGMDDLEDDKDDSDELEDGDNSDDLEDDGNDSDKLEDEGNDSDELEDGEDDSDDEGDK